MGGKAIQHNTNSHWYVYIIEASDGSYYTGVTTDMARRFKEHCGTARGAKYFRGRQAVKIVYTETHQDRSSAQRREAEIKRLPRDGKLALLRGDNDGMGQT